MRSPLAHPEANALFAELLVSLTAESDRGAVLVGAAHVDNCLRSLLEAVLPADLSRGERKQLLKYPGPLSAFAARAHVAYGLRLIPRWVYNSVNALREVRNTVAHEPETFVLAVHEDRIRQVYAALGTDFPEDLRRWATEMMLEYKADILMKSAKEEAERNPDLGLLIGSRQQALEFIRDTPDALEPLREQMLHWELAIGVAALCGMIILYRDEATTALGPVGTVGRLRKTAQHTTTDGHDVHESSGSA